MNLMIFGIDAGSHCTAICYLWLVLSEKHQALLTKFINLIQKHDWGLNSSQQGRFDTEKLMIAGESLCYCFLSIFIYTIFASTHVLHDGIEFAINDSLEGPFSTALDFSPILKRTVGITLLCIRLDLEHIIGTCQALLILIAKTLQVSSDYFIRSVRDTSKYCVVTKCEVSETLTLQKMM